MPCRPRWPQYHEPMPSEQRPVRVAILGVGTVGAEVARGFPRDLILRDAASVIRRDDVDVIVELLGGNEPARTFIADALNAGKPVVTANKSVLAHSGLELERSPRSKAAA